MLLTSDMHIELCVILHFSYLLNYVVQRSTPYQHNAQNAQVLLLMLKCCKSIQTTLHSEIKFQRYLVDTNELVRENNYKGKNSLQDTMLADKNSLNLGSKNAFLIGKK